MSSLSPKDRVSLCSFTFSDGRRCRTPRSSSNPHFCFYHAEKEARACAADKLGKDIAFFFSGDYLSACDLSTALGRLIPAVIRGEVKPKTAHTVAYLFQTLMQAIHVSQHEYCEAFDTDDWRQAIRNSVKGNYNYRFPPAPQPPEPPQPQPVPVAHPVRGEESASSSNLSLATRRSSLPQQPAPSPHTPLPATSAEFVQHVLAGRNLSRPGRETAGEQAPQPAQATQPAPAQTRSPIPTKATPAPSPTPAPASSPTSSQATQTPPSRVCHPERSEGSCIDPVAPTTDETHPISPTRAAYPVAPAAQPNDPPPIASPIPNPVLPLDSRALHFDHNCRLFIDGKPV